MSGRLCEPADFGTIRELRPPTPQQQRGVWGVFALRGTRHVQSLKTRLTVDSRYKTITTVYECCRIYANSKDKAGAKSQESKTSQEQAKSKKPERGDTGNMGNMENIGDNTNDGYATKDRIDDLIGCAYDNLRTSTYVGQPVFGHEVS